MQFPLSGISFPTFFFFFPLPILESVALFILPSELCPAVHHSIYNAYGACLISSLSSLQEVRFLKTKNGSCSALYYWHLTEYLAHDRYQITVELLIGRIKNERKAFLWGHMALSSWEIVTIRQKDHILLCALFHRLTPQCSHNSISPTALQQLLKLQTSRM